MPDDGPTRARRLSGPRVWAVTAVLMTLSAMAYVWLLVIEWDDPVGRFLNILCVVAVAISATSFGCLALQRRRRRGR